MPSQLIIIGGNTSPTYSIRRFVGSVWQIFEDDKVILTSEGEAVARCVCGLLEEQRQRLAPKRLPIIVGEVGLN